MEHLFEWAIGTLRAPPKAKLFGKVPDPEVPYKHLRHAISMSLGLIRKIYHALMTKFKIEASDEGKLSQLMKKN
jgi:hypothetical protein